MNPKIPEIGWANWNPRGQRPGPIRAWWRHSYIRALLLHAIWCSSRCVFNWAEDRRPGGGFFDRWRRHG